MERNTSLFPTPYRVGAPVGNNRFFLTNWIEDIGETVGNVIGSVTAPVFQGVGNAGGSIAGQLQPGALSGLLGGGLPFGPQPAPVPPTPPPQPSKPWWEKFSEWFMDGYGWAWIGGGLLVLVGLFFALRPRRRRSFRRRYTRR